MSKQLEYINSKIERLEYLIANPTQYNLTPTIKVRIDDSAVYKEELETLKTIKKALTTKSKKEQAFDVIKAQCVFWFEFNYLTEEWEISIYGERGMSENGIMIKVPKNIGDLLKEVLKND